MTIDLPELTVGDVVDNTKRPYSYDHFFTDAGHEMLAAKGGDVAKG